MIVFLFSTVLSSVFSYIYCMKKKDQTKNSLFFSSEESVQTALAFFTLIETCKNVGLNARDYIAITIKLLMDGNKNYDDLVPISMLI